MVMGSETKKLWENNEYRNHMELVQLKYKLPNKEEVINLYKSGYSLRKISNELNVSIWQVRKIVKDIIRLPGFKNGHKININKVCSNETKEKIRNSNLNKKYLPLSNEHKRKISIANKGKKWSDINKLKVSGKNSHLWKGGITPKNLLERQRRKYFNWRKAIFERDNYTCKITKQIGGELNVHHIENFATYKDKRYNMENGVTMNKKIHKMFHKVYGKKNNTLEQLEEFKSNYGVTI